MKQGQQPRSALPVRKPGLSGPIPPCLGQQRRVRCRACRRVVPERTGTYFPPFQSPTALGCLGGLWGMRYQVCLHALPELFSERGLVCMQETGRGRGGLSTSTEPSPRRSAELLAPTLTEKREDLAHTTATPLYSPPPRPPDFLGGSINENTEERYCSTCSRLGRVRTPSARALVSLLIL